MGKLWMLKDYKIILGYRLADFQARKGNEYKPEIKNIKKDIEFVNKWMTELEEKGKK